MIASSRARAIRARRSFGTGSRSSTSANGSIIIQNDSMTAVSASPTAAACGSTSTSNSVLPTIDSVSRFISRAMSSVAPSVHAAPHPIGIADHQVAVAGDAIAVKGRLHQAPLPQVDRAFAGQQTLAEQPLAALEAAALGEVPVVRDEHVANQLRLVDEEQLLAGHPVGADVAVGARELREEVERVARRLDDRSATEANESFGPGAVAATAIVGRV